MSDKPKKSTKRRWLRRVLIALGGLLGFVILAVAGVLIFLSTDSGRELIRSRAETQLRDTFVGGATIGRLEGSVFGDLVVRDLIINDTSGKPALAIGRAEIKFRLLPLLSSALRIEALAITELELHARQDADGVLNLATLTKPSDDPKDESDEGGSGFAVVVSDINVNDAKVHFERANAPTEHFDKVTITDSQFELLAGDIRVLLGPSSAVRRQDGTQVTLSGIARLGSNTTEVADIKIEAAGARLDIKRAQLHDNALGDIEISALVPAATVEALTADPRLLADVRLSVAGTGKSFSIKGSLGDAAIDGHGSAQLASQSARATLTIANLDLAGAWLGLPRSALELTIDVNHQGAEQTPATTVRVDGNGSIESKPLEVHQATVTRRGDRIQAALDATLAGARAIASATLELGEVPSVTESKIDFRTTHLGRLARPFVEVDGDLSATLAARGPIDALAIDGIVRSKRLVGFGVVVKDLVVSPALVQRGASASGTLVSRAASLSSGDTTLENLRVEARSSDGQRGTLLVRGLGRGAAVELDSNITHAGDVLTASVRRLSARYGDFTINGAGGTLAWHLAGKRAQTAVVTDLSLRSSAGRATISAAVQTRGQLRGTLKAEASDLDLGQVAALLGREGEMSGKASADIALDTTRRTTADVRLSGERIVLRAGVPATSGTVTATLRGRELTVAADADMLGTGGGNVRLAVRAPRQTLDAEAWMRLNRGDVQSIRGDIAVRDVSKLASLHPEAPRRGAASLRIEQAQPGEPVVVTAKGERLLFGRLGEPLGFTAGAKLAKKTIEANADLAVISRATAAFKGGATLSGPWWRPRSYNHLGVDLVQNATATLRDVDLDWFASRFAPDLIPIGAKGNAALAYLPSTRAFDVNASVELPKGGPRERKVAQATQLTAMISERKGDATIVGVFAGSERLSARGEIAFGWRDALAGNQDVAVAPASATLKVDKLPLIALREVLRTTPLRSDTTISGTLSATSSLSGTIKNPKLAANASIDGAIIADVAFASLLAGAKLENGTIDVTATGDQRGGGRLIARAETHIDGNKNAPLRATLIADKFDLSFLRELLPERDIAGLLTADVQTTGTLAAPKILGSAEVKKGQFNPGAPLARFRAATVKAKLTGTKATLSGNARSGRGRASFKANVDLVNNRPTAVSLTIATKELPLDAGTLLVRVDSQTRVSGRQTNGNWSLDANIESATIDLPDELSRSLHPTSLPGDIVFVGSEVEEAADGAMPRLPTEIAIKLRANDSILVRGGQANAVLGLGLNVVVGAELRIDGTVRADQGWVEVIGRRYDVRNAEVSFDGDLDPNLDIELAHEFSAMTLFIDLSGAASDPLIEFRSDPSQYDEAELLAFVLGASPDEPTEKGRSVATQATGVATSLVAGQLSGILTKVTPIDVLRIETADSSAERIALGKWITDKLLVAYRHRFTADPSENTGEVTFEYRFLKRWLLEGYVGQEQSGADVLWIRRY